MNENRFSRDCIVFAIALLLAMRVNAIGYVIIAGLLFGALVNALLSFFLARRKAGASGFTPPAGMPPARSYRPTFEQIAAAGEKALRSDAKRQAALAAERSSPKLQDK